MHPVWAQRREEVLSDCLISPDVFQHIVDRLSDFVLPYQHVLETEAGQRNVHLYLQGLLSHLPGKNAEDIAAFVDVERQVIQDFIGTVPWDHRPTPFNMGRATATPRLYAVVPKNSRKGSQTKTTVKRRRSGCSSSNSDVERGGIIGPW